MKRPIHKSHRMGKSFSDVRAPAGTPRFYSVRQCRGCKSEEIAHAAGQFTDDDLVKRCPGSRSEAARPAIAKRAAHEATRNKKKLRG